MSREQELAKKNKASLLRPKENLQGLELDDSKCSNFSNISHLAGVEGLALISHFPRSGIETTTETRHDCTKVMSKASKHSATRREGACCLADEQRSEIISSVKAPPLQAQRPQRPLQDAAGGIPTTWPLRCSVGAGKCFLVGVVPTTRKLGIRWGAFQHDKGESRHIVWLRVNEGL